MEKKKISVFVAGQKLTLITTESEKYVSTIASKVDTAINSMFTSSNMSKEKCAVMAALDFCDDEAKARASLNELKEQIKDYIKDSEILRQENEALKSEIEKLKSEKEELLKSKKTLIASSVEIKKTTEKTEEIEIGSDDDLSFDFDGDDDIPEIEEDEEIIDITAQQDEKIEPVTVTPTMETEKKADKKRHNHEHKNPFKERFMKQQNEQKGYTPVRQYSLFDETDE